MRQLRASRIPLNEPSQNCRLLTWRIWTNHSIRCRCRRLYVRTVPDGQGYSSIQPGSQVLIDPYLSGSHIVNFQWIFKSEPIFDIYSSPAFRICNNIIKKIIRNLIFDGLKMKKKKKVIFKNKSL